MNVLILHNRYRFEGGEERSVADLAWLLKSRGHRVEVLQRSSADFSRGRAAQSLVLGGYLPEEVANAAQRINAAVVHVHNVHPFFGWRALQAARDFGARTILHLHNFRLFCAIGVAYRDGAPCFRCRGRDTRPGLRYRCRGSLGESLAYSVGLSVQQPRLVGLTDRFIAVSTASRLRLVELGLPAAQVETLSNFARTDRVARESLAGRGSYALASGRLVKEKGFDIAIQACRQADVPLRIAGDGPDFERLHALADGGDVSFTGRLAPEVLRRLRRGAGVVLVPSRSEDSFPYSALDALSAGVPVLASAYGGLPELAGAQAVLPATDIPAWSQRLQRMWRSPETRQEAGSAGLARVKAQFSETRYYSALMAIYSGDGPTAARAASPGG